MTYITNPSYLTIPFKPYTSITYRLQPIQSIALRVPDYNTAELLATKLKFRYKADCVEIHPLFQAKTGQVCELLVCADVYAFENCFDILGFIEENKDVILKFKACGINKSRRCDNG